MFDYIGMLCKRKHAKNGKLSPCGFERQQKMRHDGVQEARGCSRLSPGAKARFNATSSTAAKNIIALGGGAHVSVGALRIEATTNSSSRSLPPPGGHVQFGLAAARMKVDKNRKAGTSLRSLAHRGTPS